MEGGVHVKKITDGGCRLIDDGTIKTQCSWCNQVGNNGVERLSGSAVGISRTT